MVVAQQQQQQQQRHSSLLCAITVASRAKSWSVPQTSVLEISVDKDNIFCTYIGHVAHVIFVDHRIAEVGLGLTHNGEATEDRGEGRLGV